MKLKSFYSVAVIVLAAGMMLGSCGKKNKDDSGPNHTLEITPSSTDSVDASGGEIVVTVKSNADWAPKSDQSWVTFDPLRGTGDGSFKAKVAANTLEQPRSAKITVSVDDSNVKKEFTVSQKPLSTAFVIQEEGAFSEKCRGVFFFWGMTPVLYYKYTVLVPGTLKLEFEDGHIHIFIHDKEPGYHTAIVSPSGEITFSADPEVPMDPDTPECIGSQNAFCSVIGDFLVNDNRAEPKIIEKHLDPGTYWSTHSLELNPDNGEGFDPMTETFRFKATFTPD